MAFNSANVPARARHICTGICVPQSSSQRCNFIPAYRASEGRREFLCWSCKREMDEKQSSYFSSSSQHLSACCLPSLHSVFNSSRRLTHSLCPWWHFLLIPLCWELSCPGYHPSSAALSSKMLLSISPQVQVYRQRKTYPDCSHLGFPLQMGFSLDMGQWFPSFCDPSFWYSRAGREEETWHWARSAHPLCGGNLFSEGPWKVGPMSWIMRHCLTSREGHVRGTEDCPPWYCQG